MSVWNACNRGSIFCRMNIRLPPALQAWLEAQVAAGRFGSVDDAVAVAVADLMAINDDDLAWAKPYVDEAHTAARRGEVVSLDDAVADIEAHIAALTYRDNGTDTGSGGYTSSDRLILKSAMRASRSQSKTSPLLPSKNQPTKNSTVPPSVLIRSKKP